MKNLKLIKQSLLLAVLLSFTFCNAQVDVELVPTIVHDTTSRYAKHIFHVDKITYETGNTDGTIFHTNYVLYGSGTSKIEGEQPAEKVYLYFTSESCSKKAKYNSEEKSIRIYYSLTQLEHIQNLLLNSNKIWVQFFYQTENKGMPYGDVHGILNNKLN